MPDLYFHGFLEGKHCKTISRTFHATIKLSEFSSWQFGGLSQIKFIWMTFDRQTRFRRTDGRCKGAATVQFTQGQFIQWKIYGGRAVPWDNDSLFQLRLRKLMLKTHGVWGERRRSPFLRSREFYFPLHWPCFRDVPTGWRVCHGRGQRRLSVIACFPQSGVPSYAIPGAPNDNFRNTSVDSVRKTNWDLEFSEHLLFACLS